MMKIFNVPRPAVFCSMIYVSIAHAFAHPIHSFALRHGITFLHKKAIYRNYLSFTRTCLP